MDRKPRPIKSRNRLPSSPNLTRKSSAKVRNMTKNAAMTYVADRIRVNSVHPGFIYTPLTDAQAPELNEVVVHTEPA